MKLVKPSTARAIDYLRNAILDNPRATERELSQAVYSKMKQADWDGVFHYWFANVFRSFKIEIDKGSIAVLKRQRVTHQQIRKAQGAKQRRGIIMEQMKNAMMDFYMPNGKLLRQCTGAELIRIGGAFAAVGKKIGPHNIVEKSLTEAQLQAILAVEEKRRAVA